MASATVCDSRSCGDLHMESLPLVDLRLLSGPELLSLSLCSASNPSPSVLQTDLVTPKIDRSVFNESAGSRKQTFSRLRLAPPRSNFHFSYPPKPLSAFCTNPLQPVGEDNAEVIRHLKALFNISHESSPIIDLDHSNLVSVGVEYKEDVSLPWRPGLQTIGVDVVAYSERKRKRGRPRKSDGENWVFQKEAVVPYENPDGMLHRNEKSGDVSTSHEIKRKRGRPRKNDSKNRVIESGERRIESEGVIQKEIVLYENPDGMLHRNEKYGSVSTSHEIKRKRGRPRKNDSKNGVIKSEERKIRSEGVIQKEDIVLYENRDGMLHTNEKFGDISTSHETKRKRGRPRKNDNKNTVIKSGERRNKSEGERKKDVLCDSVEGEMVAINEKGEMVDLVALGKIEDPFGEELRRRTEGMRTEREFLEFLKGLEGNWVSQRKKRRIVDADYFGHILPKGWKLMLFVKKNAGHMWLACRRYISPNGQQFVSCKEVSSYLLSFIRLQDTSQPNSGSTIQGINLGDKPPSEILPVTFAEHHNQAVLLNTGNSGKLKRYGKIKCHKCAMNFDLEDEFISHLLSSHQGTKKGVDHDEMIRKDGKYECQFQERHHHDNHRGLHVSNSGNKVHAEIGIRVIQPQLEKVAIQVPGVQQSVGICRDSAETASRTANDKMGSGFPSSEFESFASMHEHGLLYRDEQFLKPNRSVATFTEENHEENDRVCIAISNKMEKSHQQKNKAEEVNLCPNTSLAELKASLGAEMTLANGVPHLEDLRADSKEQSSFEDVLVISRDNEQRSDIIDKGQGVALSVTINSVQERVSEIGLASSTDENICVVNSNLNCISASSLDDPELCLSRKSCNRESTIDFLGSQEKLGTLQVRESKGTSLALHGSGHTKDSEGRVSDGTRDEFLSAQVGCSAGSVHFVSSNNTGYSANVLGDFETERIQACLQFSISSEKKVSFTQEELNQDKGSVRNLNCGQSTGYEQSNVDKSKENMYSLGGLCFSSSKAETYFEKNTNTLPMSTALEGSKFEGFENSRRSGVMMVFGDHVRPSEDAISQFVWKNGEENYMLSGLNDTSSPLLQSSGSYPTFDAITDKGEHDFFSFIESSQSDMSVIGGMRPGGIERMEYNFFSDPTSTHSENSKVTSCDSIWTEKEGMTLLPKITSRNQHTILCSWCGNPFHDEAVNISLEGVSALHMCPGCRDRFSMNNHIL